jgi:xanthine phosphoribosyltransferase
MLQIRRHVLHWFDVETACNSLAGALPPSLKAVCPIGRGGLVPAAIVSYALRIPVLGLLPLEPPPIGFRDLGNRLLIIDDIVDTGQTLRDIRGAYRGAVYAAPYVKPKGRVWCDYWAEEVPQDVWICFPWGSDE